MATNVFDTYASVGMREDLTDVIYNISPSDTPFMSNIGTNSASNRYHEWQTDALAVVGDTPIAEGTDTSALLVLQPTIRMGNRTQINSKAFGISGSDLVADNAGRGVEMAYQEAKKGLELRRDMEYHNVGVNVAQSAGTTDSAGAGTPRISASILSWIKTNFSMGATGANPVGNGTGTRTDGTQRAFTESLLTSVIDQIYLSGGDPDVIMCNTTQKRVISQTFKGSSDYRQIEVPDKRVINSVDFYESDYGVLSIVPNRYMRQRDLFVLDTSMWEIAYYRPFNSFDLAKSGDNQKKQMLAEWTLQANNEASGGIVADLS